MDVSLNVTDANRLMARLERLSAKTGVEIGFIVRDQMRLWINDIMRHAAPKNLAAGRRAIREDIERLFVPIDDKAAIQSWKQRAAQDGGDIFTVTKKGKKRINQGQLKAVSVERMHRIHKANRRKKDGRVYSRKRNRTDAFSGEFIVPRVLYNRFLKEVYGRVGFLKAQFGKAAVYYARKTRGVTPAYKNWIKRHIPGGKYTDLMTKSGSGFVKAVNDANYAGAKMLGMGWFRAVQNRQQRALARGGAKRMADLVKRFNARGAI